MPRTSSSWISIGISGAKLHAVDRSGHLAPLERPASVATALDGWLTSID